MTDRTRKRHAAAATRVLVLGASTAATLGLVAGWTAAGPQDPPQPATVRAVVTDGRIDPVAAAHAAAAAAASGRTSATVAVAADGGDPQPSSVPTDTTTSAS